MGFCPGSSGQSGAPKGCSRWQPPPEPPKPARLPGRPRTARPDTERPPPGGRQDNTHCILRKNDPGQCPDRRSRAAATPPPNPAPHPQESGCASPGHRRRRRSPHSRTSPVGLRRGSAPPWQDFAPEEAACRLQAWFFPYYTSSSNRFRSKFVRHSAPWSVMRIMSSTRMKQCSGHQNFGSMVKIMPGWKTSVCWV